ncbi:HTH-type transcriptional activator AllS (plasmid) [Labrenzia sp. THAF191b]|uniref:LysR family transcriptional regulator n=1 Tax=unclassified Labrenzia TaxID=2648686 RepID=UPI001267E5D2|nr:MULTISPECIES: LysR family transcriptional regulator [unclassified Labrenzia]QFT01607.1 HTH-type transcriptional activator AllS [Labrenzia sp. THAF191b]QFT07812.1 HTH-type transcriptional activator AllS [Labrenzia sp. THAF191a]QFT19322.1 HTH-type transcriptional activator AllS [Labrenzia sp. THAF187b]
MLDALTLDQMRTFVAIADSGSFRAAAQSLSRVQSGVSVAIANLEAQLGVELFDRSGHRPVLTRQGQMLLGSARDILLRVDVLRAKARGFAAGVETELGIAVDTLYPLQKVGTAISQMRESFPSVSVRVQVEPLGGPLEALRQKSCALAVMVGEDFRDPRIKFDALTSIIQVALVAAEHPLAKDKGARALEALDLADHLQIVLTDPSQISAGRDFGVLSPQSCRVNTQDAKYNLILGGLGWGRLPLWLVERDLEQGRLVRLNVSALGRNGEVAAQAYVAHRLDETMGPAARHLADALISLNSGGT